MDIQHARSIATRADSIRSALDSTVMTPRRYAIFLLYIVVFCVAYQALAGVLRHWGLSVSASMWVAMVPAIIWAFFTRRWLRAWRAAQTRSVTDKMLCPRCRYILREQGPAHWETCGSTIRVCPECANAVSDDVYAAAVLPALKLRLRKKHERSLRGMVSALWPLAVLLGGMPALLPLGLFLERLGLADADLFALWGILVVFLLFGAGLVYAFPRVHRAPDARTARWLDAPFCAECDAPFPPGALESPILRCSSCDARLSTAVAITDSHQSRRGLTLD